MTNNRITTPSPKQHTPSTILALSLGLFLFALYLFTYRGGFHSVDEVSTFAVTESLVKFGTLNTNQIAWTQWTTTQAEAQGFFGLDGNVYSKKGLALSLFQAPLYWLALHLKGVGMLQLVSLLNAVLTALSGALIYIILQQLDFSVKGAITTALLYGVGTIAWVYAKYLFSGTLAGVLLLATTALLFHYQTHHKWWHLGLAGFLGGLTVLARANNLLLLTIFGSYLLFFTAKNLNLTNRRSSGCLQTQVGGQQSAVGGRRSAVGGQRSAVGGQQSPYLLIALKPLILFSGGAAIAGLMLLWYNWMRSGNPFQTGYDLSLFSPNILLGLYKLLFSPLRGLFIYSPLLILAGPGWFKLKQTHPAPAWLIFALVGTNLFLFSAWSSGEGLSWGSRFMVPIVPFLVIAIAPIIENAYQQKLSPLKQIMLLVLCGVSITIQIIGVSINPWVYLAQLQQNFGGEFFLEKTAALYDFSTMQIIGQLQNWHIQNSDLAWWQAWGFDEVAFGLSLGLMIWCGCVVRWQSRKVAGSQGGKVARSQGNKVAGSQGGKVAGLQGGKIAKKQSWGVISLTMGITLGISYILLSRYYHTDRQFGLADNAYINALSQIAANYNGADKVLTVAESEYHVAMNRFKDRVPLIGFAQSANGLAETAYPLLSLSANTQAKQIWLVTARYTPANPTVQVEAWLAENAFKSSDEWITGPSNLNIRLIRYGIPQSAASVPIKQSIGSSITLSKVNYPRTITAETILPVSFYWQPSTTLTDNYIIFLQLLDIKGKLVAQHDGPPQGGYTPTTNWLANQTIIDHHGLNLPSELSTGDYRLIAGLYNANDGQRLTVDGGSDFVELGNITIK